MDKAMDIAEDTHNNDGQFRPIVYSDYKILSALVQACYVTWNRAKKEPPNFMRVTLENPDYPKFGTWHLIITKREGYNPYDHIEEQKKQIEALEQESKEWQADFVNVSEQLKTCQRMLDQAEES